MKRGCFLRSIVYLIIIAAVVIYLIDKYGKPVYETSKQKLTEVFLEQLEDQFTALNTESISDSITAIISGKVNEIKYSEQLPDSTKIANLVDEIKNYIDKNSDEITDLSKLKEIITDYEQRQKDGN